MNSVNLKNKIMLRVYLMYTKNLFVERFDYFMVAFFIAISLLMVSTRDVLNNMPMSDLYSFLNFVFVAVRDTSIVIQIFIAGFLIRAGVASFKLNYRNLWARLPLLKLKY